uniref:Uncharacterized protein n=1 Tax=Rhizophora mucronata TaxID=61149 RepID=A0A2P2IIP7_RHIMU
MIVRHRPGGRIRILDKEDKNTRH